MFGRELLVNEECCGTDLYIRRSVPQQLTTTNNNKQTTQQTTQSAIEITTTIEYLYETRFFGDDLFKYSRSVPPQQCTNSVLTENTVCTKSVLSEHF
jgi:hypothetical protein